MTPLLLRGGLRDLQDHKIWRCWRSRGSRGRRVRIPGNEHNSSIPRVPEYAGTRETPAEGMLRRFFSVDWARIRAGSVLGVVGCAGGRESAAGPAQLVKLRVI